MNLGALLSLDVWGFTASSWLLFFFAVFIVGFSKTGLPGITIVAVPIMAMLLPPKLSVGVLLPIYMAADIFSVFSYFKYAKWRYCFPYLLFVAIGVAAASAIVGRMTDANFGTLIGWTILALLTVNVVVDFMKKRVADTQKDDLPPEERPTLASSAFFGVLVGMFSAMANAAGPLVSLYLIRARLPKFAFLGTTAFCAFVMNWIKVPLFVKLGILNAQTLKLCLISVPVIVAGSVTGILVAQRIPQHVFKNAVMVLAYAASLKLALG